MRRYFVVLLIATAALAVASPASATFAGANGRIAASFSYDDSRPCGDMGGHICEGDSFSALRTLRPSGGGVRELCRDCGGGVSWSRDGRRIAFVDSNYRIRIADANGRSQRTIGPAKANEVTWSPDGRSLVYVDWLGALSRISIRGGTPRKIAPARRVTDSSPSWCSTGRIVFIRSRGAFPRLYSVKPNGRGLRQLTPSGVASADCGPRGRVLYTSATQTHVVRADGRGRSRVLFTRRLNDAVLSPDGHWIAYWRDWQIWKVRTDGRGTKRLSPRAGASNRPLEDQPTEAPARHNWTSPAWQPRPRR